jgi:methylase of polypeptide subunit release factors
MVNLSQGSHDATGHKVWMGAYMFVEAIAKDEFLQSLFRMKCVLELGCGTGVAGLALLDESENAPASIVFTDSNPASLELCRQNCLRNLSANDKRYSVARLHWGSAIGRDSFFDTILATDVLYDI